MCLCGWISKEQGQVHAYVDEACGYYSDLVLWDSSLVTWRAQNGATTFFRGFPFLLPVSPESRSTHDWRLAL